MTFGKRCSKCRRYFHPSDFHRDGTGRHSWCRWCMLVYAQRYRRRMRRAAIVRAVLAS